MRSGFFRTVIVVLALSFPLSSSALAQTNAAPFPRDGAKKLQDNGYFIIWDVTFQPGKSTGALKLPLDQVAMFLTDGPIKYTKPDGTWAIEHNKVGSVRYTSKGTVETAEAVGAAPVRAMVFQLTDATPPKVPVQPGVPDKFPRDYATKLFETDRVILYDYTWKKGFITKPHVHYHLDAGVWIQAGSTCVGDQKPSVRVFGEIIGGGKVTVGAPPMAPHQERQCGGDAEARAISIILK